MEGELLKTTRLSKWYGKIIGLNDVTLSLGGGIHGLLGVNGSGKSTFIKIITGMMRQSRGDLTILGEKPWDNPHLHSKIGYCPEGMGLYDDMTGEGFLTYMALSRGLSFREAEKEARKSIKEVGLTEASQRKLKGYSRGMRQRIKVAQAIMLNPPLLILDEPLNGTDPFARLQLMGVIRNRVKEGTNVIFASHILFEVEELTEKVVVFHRGNLIAEGKIWEIRSLLDSIPLKIFLRTTNPIKISTDLLEFDEIEGIFKQPAGIVLHVRKPLSFYPKLQRYLIENHSPVEEYYPLDENLDNLFNYLIAGVKG